MTNHFKIFNHASCLITFTCQPFQYDGTFSDHLEMLVQMGYVVLFSAAFPLAGVCALVNNLMEIRSDAFKLAHVHQRPFGQRVANIGTWQNALSLLSLAAVIVNCALIGLSGQVSRLWPGLTTAQTIILIVTLEVKKYEKKKKIRIISKI